MNCKVSQPISSWKDERCQRIDWFSNSWSLGVQRMKQGANGATVGFLVLEYVGEYKERKKGYD